MESVLAHCKHPEQRPNNWRSQCKGPGSEPWPRHRARTGQGAAISLRASPGAQRERPKSAGRCLQLFRPHSPHFSLHSLNPSLAPFCLHTGLPLPPGVSVAPGISATEKAARPPTRETWWKCSQAATAPGGATLGSLTREPQAHGHWGVADCPVTVTVTAPRLPWGKTL